MMMADTNNNPQGELGKIDISDSRWWQSAEHRFSEIGVVGADQIDESHFDDRSIGSDEDGEEPQDEKGRIRFSKKLFGRDKELARCHSIYELMMKVSEASSTTATREDGQEEKKDDATGSSLPPVVFLSGFSGCGKSSLVKEFVKQLDRKSSSNLFLATKHEAMQRQAPYSAFGDLFRNIDPRKRKEFALIRAELEDALGDDTVILGKLFPHLLTLLGLNDGGDTSTVSSTTASVSNNNGSRSSLSGLVQKPKFNKNRLKFVCKLLFRSLSTAGRPLVLFIDDLQWADDHSIDLLSSLLTDPSLKYLFFVGAFRSNEVGSDHVLASLIDEIGKKRAVEVMELPELSSKDVGRFIADSLRLDTDDVLPLTEAVFAKTLGNPLFTMQALEQLVRKNVLYYDTMTFGWAWNLRKGEQFEELLSADIVEMVKCKIDHMPKSMQKVLVVASYTRTTFDVDTLLALLHPEAASSAPKTVGNDGVVKKYNQIKEEVLDMLDQAAIEGLLRPSGPTKEEYSFVHDRILEAANTFVTDQERDRLLTQIGNALATRADSGEGEDWMFFSATQRLNSVSMSYRNCESNLKLSKLNLRAAELSLDVLAFESAIDFVENGLRNLPSAKGGMLWEKHYDLALQFHSIGAEAYHGVGKVEESENFCNEVLRQEKNTMYDAIPVYKIYVDILSGKSKKEEAFYLTIDILAQLGVTFPKKEQIQRVKAWNYLRQTKARYIPTEEKMNDMPYVSDPVIIDTLDFLEKAGSFCFLLNMVPFYVLLRCKWIRMMYKYGLTDGSGGAVASFANVLMHVYGDFETGTRLAELALLIQDRLRSKWTEPGTLNKVNMFVLGWVRPLKTRLVYHHRAYDSGLLSGNIEGAMIGKWFSYWVIMHSAAMPLAALEEDCSTFIPKMRAMGLHFYANLSSLIWQTALNLMGKSDNTIILTGTAMNESDITNSKSVPFRTIAAVRKSFLFVVFGDWERGAEDALERGDGFYKKIAGAFYGLEPCWRGVCLFAMARKTGESKYRKPALKVLKQVKGWVQNGCVNLVSLLQVLEAESAALSGKKKQANSSFQAAIKGSLRDGFYQNAALASERYAAYLSELDDITGAKRQLEHAVDCYRRWGATRKVELLRDELVALKNS